MDLNLKMQGDHGGQDLLTTIWLFACLSDSAWAAANWAEINWRAVGQHCGKLSQQNVVANYHGRPVILKFYF